MVENKVVFDSKTLNHLGVRYWFKADNRRDQYNPHIVQITVSNRQIVNATCTCTHGTIQIDSKFRGNKRCTHIKEAIKILQEKNII